MRIEKVGRKYIVRGKNDGWVFNRFFPTKWKAKVAVEVFKNGGRVSDYWKKQREVYYNRPYRRPYRVLERINKSYDRIKELNPSCEEIEEYAKIADYGEVTYTGREGKFEPRIHDTWGEKRGGRVHIDIGCRGYHLMLNKNNVESFIHYIEDKRKYEK